MNNTTETEIYVEGIPISWKFTINVLILIFALVGNLLLVTSLLRSKRLRESITNMLILNLAFCDTFIVTVSIVANSIETKMGHFPFGEFGCKILYPISTLAIISSVATLVLLSFERFVAVVFPFRYRYLKPYTISSIVICHVFSFICVVPYAYHLKLQNYDGYIACSETWSTTSGAVYTVFLFVLQYALPLPVIVSVYGYSWFRIKRQNDEVIRVVEQQRERVGRIDEDLLARSRTELMEKYQQSQKKSSFRKRISSLKRKKQQSKNRIVNSQLAINRQKQTTGMMKSIVCIVTVFAVCMLPNQITWLWLTFGETQVSDIWLSVAYWLTYGNCVLNPIIYGINPKFRRAYIRQFKRFTSSCLYKISNSRFSSTFRFSTYSGDTDTSLADGSPGFQSFRRLLTDRHNSIGSVASSDSFFSLTRRARSGTHRTELSFELGPQDNCNSTEKDIFYFSNGIDKPPVEEVSPVESSQTESNELPTKNVRSSRAELYRCALKNSIKQRCFDEEPTVDVDLEAGLNSAIKIIGCPEDVSDMPESVSTDQNTNRKGSHDRNDQILENSNGIIPSQENITESSELTRSNCTDINNNGKGNEDNNIDQISRTETFKSKAVKNVNGEEEEDEEARLNIYLFENELDILGDLCETNC